ncbi:MAG: nicotinate-nucleotide adenylyltransferase [Parvibaculaceae bacterium]|nr:nicotinate-nucleotide adenylyltransferase [Parvibaculaceae bacterium]
MRRLPAVPAGRRIGLLGGSFNPAHEGHVHLSEMARRALRLDEIWWLVSPQNPLKPVQGMRPLNERLAGARAMAKGHPIRVSDLERVLGTRYTVDTIEALQARYRGVRFVWLMGADNMAGLPRWSRWRGIVARIPVAVYPRPGHTLKARLALAASVWRGHCLDPEDAALLAAMPPPALVFLAGREHPASATAIRARTGR